MSVHVHDVVVEEAATGESRAAFHAQVSDRLGISGAEFLWRLDRGEYDMTDSEDIIRLRMLAPFGR